MSSDVGLEVVSGLLMIDKPAGITSHDAIDRIRRALGVRKVGHAGTLDPMATGLLLVGVGRATRLLRFLGQLPKSYDGEGTLGVRTDTLDAEGQVTERAPCDHVGAPELRGVMARLTGDVEQIPPVYSAVKVGGERSYRAARRGAAVAAPLRTVRVDAFELTGFEPPRFRFTIRCSGGTYVRSLVAEVGERLCCGAHLSALRRTAIGPFTVGGARRPDDPGTPLPIDRAVAHLPSITLQAEEARVAAHGSVLGPAGLPGPYRVLAPDGGLIGIYRDDASKAVPEVIVA